MTEYELVGHELALTVLRSIGYISRNDNPWREDPAGPEIPIPAAQLRGPCSFAFAYYPSAASIHEQAERYRHPFVTGRGTGGAGELHTHSGPALEGDNAVVITCLQPDRARVVNESAEALTVAFEGARLELGPWEIRTVVRRSD